jgi:PAS domain S-box-containing protein
MAVECAMRGGEESAIFPSRALRLVFDQVPGAMWATDRALRLTQVVGKLPHASGLSERVLGETVGEVLGATDPTDPMVAHHLAALGGSSGKLRYQFRDRWYQIQIEPLRGGQDEIIGTVGVAIDVSERQEAERQRAQAAHELERSVSLLRATLDATADGLLVVDRAGRAQALNQQFVEQWQLPQNLVDTSDDEAMLSFAVDQLAEPATFRDRVRELYQHPEAESFDVLYFRDGRVFERVSRPVRDGHQVVGRVWSFRDVTERERILHRALFLADASRLLASLQVEQALEAVARLSVPSLGAACAIDLLGSEGLHRLIAVQHDGAGRLSSGVPRAVLSGQPLLDSTGSVSLIAVPFLAHGEPLGALSLESLPGRHYGQADLSLAEEVAHRAAVAIENGQLYRQSRDALRARDEVISIAAHEIRGPVTSIHLAAQTLNDPALEASGRARLVSVIQREDRRLARFVDDLLDVGRIRLGAFTFDLTDVDLVQVAREVTARMGDDLARAKVALSLITDPCCVGKWDRMRLDELLSALLANAIKFGLGRPIEVRVSCVEGRAELSVLDHGIGVAPEAVERIFDPFQRDVSVRQYGGVGLGLYIVRTIAEGLGGSVAVGPTPGGGATFLVRLPCTRQA